MAYFHINPGFLLRSFISSCGVPAETPSIEPWIPEGFPKNSRSISVRISCKHPGKPNIYFSQAVIRL
jgi:hypothetical protein